jgi:hypothetical protein
MSAYNKPTENLVDFNSSVFKTANEGTLTLSQAKGLFLGRTGTPNSVATTTSFNGGDIYVKGARVGLGAGSITSNVSVGTNALTANTAGTLNTAVGTNALAANVLCYYNTAIGYSALTNSGVGTHGFENTAVGAYCLNTNTIGDENSAIGSSAYYSNSTGVNLAGVGYAAGYKNTTGSYNTNLGWCSGYTNTTGTYNTYVGASVVNPTPTTFSFSTALGALTVIGASSSTAIGYGATTTVANSVVLGTAAETVFCKGLVNQTSLRTTGNIVVNGAVFGIGSGVIADANIYIGQGDGNVGTGGSNTIVGRNTLTPSDALSVRNTFLGTNAGLTTAQTGQVENTIIGAFSYNQATAYANTSCLGYNCVLGGSYSTAIGSGATTTLANTVVLGRNLETVLCPGTTSNGSIALASHLQLQGSYTTGAGASQLGYQLSNGTSGFAIASFTTGTQTNISSAGISLTAGVWSINYTIELLAITGPATVQAQTLYCSLTSAGAYVSTRMKPCGQIRIHTTNTYSSGDTPAFSGNFTYYTNVADIIYPIFQITFTTGTFSGTGFYVATRVG